MKILRLAAENFKRLVAVELELDPDGGLVMITGKNGAGKTCTMDIVSACLGGKKLCPEKPIRKGQKSAEIEVETEDWTVTRRFTEGGNSTLKVVKSDQSIIPKGQSFLDSVLGAIALDPLLFVNESDAKKQRKILLDLVGVDLTELDGEIKALRDQRTAIGRTLKQAEAEADAAVHYPDAPEQEISAGELAAELQKAHEYNVAVQMAEARVVEIREEMAELQKELTRQQAYLINNRAEDEAVLELKVTDAEETNRQVRANADCTAKKKHCFEVNEAYENMTAKIKAAESEKDKTLEDAQMPVEGLSVDEDGVTFNSIPIAQIAESEKIKVGLAVSMALNPTLKVLLIRDGSLLDADNMALIEDMVKEKGFQALIERVDNGSGEVGFVIEDGQLKGA